MVTNGPARGLLISKFAPFIKKSGKTRGLGISNIKRPSSRGPFDIGVGYVTHLEFWIE